MNQRTAALCAVLATPAVAFAHEGHGLSGSHWHASDAWGYVLIAACVALAWWSSRGK